MFSEKFVYEFIKRKQSVHKRNRLFNTMSNSLINTLYSFINLIVFICPLGKIPFIKYIPLGKSDV